MGFFSLGFFLEADTRAFEASQELDFNSPSQVISTLEDRGELAFYGQNLTYQIRRRSSAARSANLRGSLVILPAFSV